MLQAALLVCIQGPTLGQVLQIARPVVEALSEPLAVVRTSLGSPHSAAKMRSVSTTQLCMRLSAWKVSRHPSRSLT